jgi:hypothetical protein
LAFHAASLSKCNILKL